MDLLNDGVLVAKDFASVIDLPDAPFDRPVYVPRQLRSTVRSSSLGSRVASVSQDEEMEVPDCDPGAPAAVVLDLRDGRTEWRTVATPEPLRHAQDDRP